MPRTSRPWKVRTLWVAWFLAGPTTKASITIPQRWIGYPAAASPLNTVSTRAPPSITRPRLPMPTTHTRERPIEQSMPKPKRFLLVVGYLKEKKHSSLACYYPLYFASCFWASSPCSVLEVLFIAYILWCMGLTYLDTCNRIITLGYIYTVKPGDFVSRKLANFISGSALWSFMSRNSFCRCTSVIKV